MVCIYIYVDIEVTLNILFVDTIYKGYAYCGQIGGAAWSQRSSIQRCSLVTKNLEAHHQ